MYTRLATLIDKITEDNKGKAGISFYNKKEDTYCFIETTKPQRFVFKCAMRPKLKEDPLHMI